VKLAATGKWRVQDGHGRSSYRDRWVFDNASQASAWYRGINTGNGYKKRLVSPEGKVVARYIS
jgi:hypothetical protein